MQKLVARHHELLLMKARMKDHRFKRVLTWKLRNQTITKDSFLLTLQKLEARHHEILLMKARMEARRFKRALNWNSLKLVNFQLTT